uniref:Uncharacterized protein n=1 Tax=Palpitomonas bilix TaxID=652834 RepID=A0A7S3GD04_9EUKA|mmetsp:Transcript_44087/g.114723  ORF Transcript_44087/g.114723 Transcript_44087/m.114723 type:complete len:163 (+) Transcript_44087:95-583(+)
MSLPIGCQVSIRSDGLALFSCEERLLSAHALKSVVDHVCSTRSPFVVSLRGCGLGGNHVLILNEVLESPAPIRGLYLDWNSIGAVPSIAKSFFAAVASSSQLEELDLRNCALSPSCLESLCHALAVSRSLRRVDIRWNNLGRDGGAALLSALSQNVRIEVLL